METSSSGTPALDGGEGSTSDPALASAYRDLRAAIERREAEHARRDRHRAVFSRAVILLIVAILIGLLALLKSFDVDIFKHSLEAKLTEGAPSVVRGAQAAVTNLVPVYQKEVERTLPKFTETLADSITKEASNMAETVAPLAKGDAHIYTGEADSALAKALMTRFGKELHNDFGEARALATALRNQQILNAGTMLDTELVGPFADLHDIEMSLRGMGPPDKELISKGDTIESIGKAALDVVKARLISGEGFGFDDDKAPNKGAHKAEE